MSMKKMCFLGIAFLFVIAAVGAAYESRGDVQAGTVKTEHETISHSQESKQVRVKFTFDDKEAKVNWKTTRPVGISSNPCR